MQRDGFRDSSRCKLIAMIVVVDGFHLRRNALRLFEFYQCALRGLTPAFALRGLVRLANANSELDG